VSVAEKTSDIGARISASDPVHGQIVDFLTDEAYILDDNRHMEWADRYVTDDVVYVSHRRKTVYRAQGNGIKLAAGEFNDTKRTLILRARRNTEIPSAFDRDPEPRICRLIGNIVVHETDKPDEYAVRSRIVLYRNRFDDTTYDMITANRSDLIRFTAEGPKLARREILPDIARPGAPFPNVFL
jgi:3-phenylpropionate/cinnamic acid dioxygenase small subunit